MLESAIEAYGDGAVLFAVGFAVGILFGAAAQHSRFCLRAATIEVFEGAPAGRMAVWLIVFFSALAATQLAIRMDWLDVTSARQISATGSLSGAIIGGLLFGAGMILARGCASRLLVLSGTGNMRALVAGLVVTLVAQASYKGVLAPAREALAALWTIPGGADRDLSSILSIGRDISIILALLGLAGGIWLAARSRIGIATGVSALLVGFAVTLGWLGTWAVASVSFEVNGAQEQVARRSVRQQTHAEIV